MKEKNFYIFYVLAIFSYITFIFIPLYFLLFYGQEIFSFFGFSNFGIFFYGVLIFQIFSFITGIYFFKFFSKKAKKYKTKIKKEEKKEPLLKLKGKKLYIVTFLLTFFFIFLSYLTQRIGINYFNLKDSQETIPLLFSLGFIPSVFLVGLLGILEEKIFREILQGELEKKIKGKYLNYIIPVFISSLIFALAHNQGKYNFLIFFLGFLLGTVYYVFKNIKINMFIHASNNILGIVILFLTTTSPFHSITTTMSPYFQNQVGILSKVTYSYSLFNKKEDKTLLYADFISSFLKDNIKEKDIIKMKTKLNEALKYKSSFTENDKKIIHRAKSLIESYESKIKK